GNVSSARNAVPGCHFAQSGLRLLFARVFGGDNRSKFLRQIDFVEYGEIRNKSAHCCSKLTKSGKKFRAFRPTEISLVKVSTGHKGFIEESATRSANSFQRGSGGRVV